MELSILARGALGEGVLGGDALMVSAKLLREDTVSLLKSSIFFSITVATGVTSMTGAGGGGGLVGTMW